MGTIIYNTIANFSGPWLLDEKQLKDLDVIVQDAITDIKRMRDADIESETDECVERELKYHTGEGDFERDEVYQKIRSEVEDRYKIGIDVELFPRLWPLLPSIFVGQLKSVSIWVRAQAIRNCFH